MNTISFTLNPAVTTRAVSELRASVGWEPFEREEQHRWDGYWATVGGFDEQGTLIAWCALLSDGQQHGVLLDVMVHPQRQKQGIGRALVAEAIDHFRAQRIRIIHVDFLPERAAFYERCGFRIGLGGIYQL
jgi:GNAT superfamily N-acetyltransferase